MQGYRAGMASDATTVDVDSPAGVRSIRVSSPNRVLWPALGITKIQLAEYMVAVGAPFIAAVGGRPLSLQRFAEGVDGEQFFSKNPPRGVPEFMRSVNVTYPSGREHAQLVLDEPAAAVWAVQMNTIVFHPWPSRVENTDNPDELRLDLDPQPGTDFADAVVAAFELKRVLAEAGLTAFVKTSGNRGLHVFAPIVPEHEFLQVRHGAIAIARELERRLPDRVTTSWWKEERGSKIFVDYNQTARDRTMAGAYSPRALAHAPVSCPLGWDELENADPREFTVLTVPGRLETVGDPWRVMHETQGDLNAAFHWWDRDVAAGLGELSFPPDYPKMPGEPPRVQPSRAKNMRMHP